MAVNETLNATSDVVASGATHSFVPLVFIRLWDILAAPFRHGEMMWIILPLFFTLIVMEFYYDRNRDEELGWGAAVANSLVMIFIAIDLLKTSFPHQTPWDVLTNVMLYVFADAPLEIAPQVLVLVLFIGGCGIAVTLINYFHLLPKKMAFIVSSHPPINFLAFFAIVIVYTTGKPYAVPLDIATCVAGLLLFILLCAIVFGIKKLTGKAAGD